MEMGRWTRRRFVATAGLGALSLAGLPLARARAPDWGQAFARALEANPMLLGWQGIRTDSLECTARIEGRLPEELRGTFYRNGPAVHERFGMRYHHLFDGDGMVQAFRFDGRGVTHRARVVLTPKLARETDAGQRLYSGFGSPIHDRASVRRPDDVNTANISVLDHRGELLALWEAGSASILDRESLEWRGFKTWGNSLEGLPFTAHPKVEPDGTLWAFGVNLVPHRALVLYHIGPDGTVVKAKAIDASPIGMVHDFVVTERSLILVIPPLVYEPHAGGALIDALQWRPEFGTRVLVVDKDGFNARRWYQLPAGFGFHHGNGWEDAAGVIRFDHCIAANPSLMTRTMRDLMRGELTRGAPELYTRFTLHPDGRAEMESSGDEEEFPRVAPAVVGKRNRFVYTVGVSSMGPSAWGLRRVVRRDVERGTSEAFDYGPGVIAEEHVFVPRRSPRSEDDGWLVGAFLDYEQELSGFAVFDAGRIADGPIAKGWLDYPLPLGFHGEFSTAQDGTGQLELL